MVDLCDFVGYPLDERLYDCFPSCRRVNGPEVVFAERAPPNGCGGALGIGRGGAKSPKVSGSGVNNGMSERTCVGVVGVDLTVAADMVPFTLVLINGGVSVETIEWCLGSSCDGRRHDL